MKIRILLALIICFVCSPAMAQVLIPHQSMPGMHNADVQGTLMLSDVEYDFDAGGDAEIERTIVGISSSYGLNQSLSMFGEFGLIAESEIENSRDDGNGFLLGAGLKGPLMYQGRFSVTGFGGIRFIDEDYGDSVDGQLFELHGGVVGRYALEKNLGVYAGLDIIPFSDGEVDAPGGKSDFERDNILGLRLGIDFLIQEVQVNTEVALVSEEAFVIRIGTKL